SISEKNENENYVRKQLEVDFVCNLGYERIYIQSALNIDEVAKKEQEERSLIRIDDSFINEKRTIEIALKIDLLIWILRKLR
ncbi:MAG: ATP-binding protein, partial [Bacilli bacterium]|nr:ATP-binding protein [Bacilli bacterium]